MRLHVLTAVTRTENLPTVAASLAEAAATSSIDVVWHWRFDLDHQHVGGQAVKNHLIDHVRDGWVWCLDDDTLAHPDVLNRVGPHLRGRTRMVIVSQTRAEGFSLRAHPDGMRPGGVDIGQAFIKRSAIGGHRIPENYDGDGMFLATLAHELGSTVVYLDESLSRHNWLELEPVYA